MSSVTSPQNPWPSQDRCHIQSQLIRPRCAQTGTAPRRPSSLDAHAVEGRLDICGRFAPQPLEIAIRIGGWSGSPPRPRSGDPVQCFGRTEDERDAACTRSIDDPKVEVFEKSSAFCRNGMRSGDRRYCRSKYEGVDVAVFEPERRTRRPPAPPILQLSR